MSQKYGGYRMKERIVQFKESPRKNKKYRATIRDIQSGVERHIDFGARDYEQYKDRTPLRLYSHKDHGTRRRMKNYYSRHSGTSNRTKAIKTEKRKSRGRYNAKILSHLYLW